METRKIIKMGSSLAVVIPAAAVEQMQLKKGDTVAWIKNEIVKIKEVTNEKL